MADWMEELERLAELRDKGLITDDEYEAERVKIVPTPNKEEASDSRPNETKNASQIPNSSKPNPPHGNKSHLRKRTSSQPPPPKRMTPEQIKRLERVALQEQKLKKMAWRWRRKNLFSNYLLITCFILAVIISSGHFVGPSIACGILACLAFAIRSKAKKELLECGFAQIPISPFNIFRRYAKIVIPLINPLIWLDHTWPNRTWVGNNPFRAEPVLELTDGLRDKACPKCGPQVFIPIGSDQKGHISAKCSTCDEIKISKEPILAHYSEEERAICLNGMRTEMEYWSAIDPVYHPPKGYIADKLF